MGWSSATGIFDPVAQALIDCKAPDNTKTRVLGTLIKALQDGDWDTAEDSLYEFKDDPAIVAAFRQRGVHLRCKAQSADERLDCDLEPGHEGDHRDWQGTVWPLAVEEG